MWLQPALQVAFVAKGKPKQVSQLGRTARVWSGLLLNKDVIEDRVISSSRDFVCGLKFVEATQSSPPNMDGALCHDVTHTPNPSRVPSFN
ncbi:hypothetical protein ILYODFUR_029752 [Ilyodon furcidens]|uniref:Uncharacterized protein n=1 Tax=Ilyodon furcidens TaxID=33524 RepID=A0ABV0VA37_9TELE